MTATDLPASRVEVIDAVGEVFAAGPLHTQDLLRAADALDAGGRVMALLQRLPERVYRRPADMWDEMPEVPIEP